MSNTKNVKLGVCQISFGGRDLGYTKGGVAVSVKTDTHKVQIDQFGKTPINEYVMGREVSVKVPLAETTIPNLVGVMPGATLFSNGAAATGTVTFGATVLTDGMTIILNGTTITFRVATPNASNNEVLIGTAGSNTATNLAAFLGTLAGSGNAALEEFSAVAAGSVVTLTANIKGSNGNNFTLNSGTAAADVTMSGATLAGGVDGTIMRVDVPTGVGLSLLDSALPLVLHPIYKPSTDHSEDFTVYRAATAGALNFAYDLEKERVFDVDFTGYPNSLGDLFGFGDPAAV